MSSGFLDADCVIENLVNLGFIFSNPLWKRRTRELYYTASFERICQNNSRVSYEVIVVDGVHQIPESTVRLHENKYSKKMRS